MAIPANYTAHGNKMPHHAIRKTCEDSMSFDSISNLVFCCYTQRDPQVFILLIEILISECLYLAFRVFIVAKVDFEKLISAKPLLIFFMLKNFLFIVNQVYRVYSKSNEYRKQRLIEKYKDFILANGNLNNQNQRNGVNFQPHVMKENIGQFHPKFNVNGGFSFIPLHKNAAIAAAATGGQVPLVQTAQSQFYFNEEVAPNQNPYRFAQIYNDQPQIFTNGKVMSNSLLSTPNAPSKMPNNLSSASAAYINEHANNSSNIYSQYSHSQNQTYLNPGSLISLGNGNSSNNPHIPDYQQHRTSLSTLLSESLLEMMDKENEQLQQSNNRNISSHDHAANLALCQQKALHLSVQNNCVSKPGNKFYGLPIKSSHSSSNNKNNNQTETNLNSASTSSLLKNSSTTNMSNAGVSGKQFRGAKI
jgi:hypothetical protein